ncbi:hypothetical protein AXI58_04665 [Bacillus nakamurai]|uniref:Uncharacterized protein n=1 Tax=Bacillus nakamurai TaxID=1793963 RepID=A0A150F2Y5_9BACI|nr:hypothetical protein AXI58_04665 [Bacillus nakamurai]
MFASKTFMTISFHSKYFNKILPWKNEEKDQSAVQKGKMNNLIRVFIPIYVFLKREGETKNSGSCKVLRTESI